MAYATKDDIVTLYSETALYVADRDGDGLPDEAAISRALSGASSEIDSFLGVRYPVPLPHVTDLVMQMTVDMALYRLASSNDVLTDEHRRRYEDAIAHLKRLGKMNIL